MQPDVLGKKYDKIASWWQEQHDHSDYGVAQLERALRLHGDNPLLSTQGKTSQPPDSASNSTALDVGCGAGGRLIRRLVSAGFRLTGLDVSIEMIQKARKAHPTQTFVHADICHWQVSVSFDFILAWDSIFHLPLKQQAPVLRKLCQALKPGGTLLYTFGNAVGEHEDQWRDDTFYYSSIGIRDNLQLLLDQGLSVAHLELDQYPERHIYVIATRPTGSQSATGYDAPHK